MTEENEVKPRGKFNDSSDPTLLAVRGQYENKDEAKVYIKGLAKAISVVFQKHQTVKLRCIGAASLNNAIKAHIIASGEASKKGVSLALIPSFTTVSLDGDLERTAVVLEVIDYDEKSTSEPDKN